MKGREPRPVMKKPRNLCFCLFTGRVPLPKLPPIPNLRVLRNEQMLMPAFRALFADSFVLCHDGAWRAAAGDGAAGAGFLRRSGRPSCLPTVVNIATTQT